MDISNKRSELISKLSVNLSALRAKMKITQSDLANAVGIGRQTLIAIENGTSKMRWDTFLAMMFIISKDPDAAELLELLDLKFSELNDYIENIIYLRKENSPVLQDKLWTECNCSSKTIRGFVPLPIGLKNTKCPKCGQSNIRGVLITLTADEQDPNIVCIDCGYWWD